MKYNSFSNMFNSVLKASKYDPPKNAHNMRQIEFVRGELSDCNEIKSRELFYVETLVLTLILTAQCTSP